MAWGGTIIMKYLTILFFLITFLLSCSKQEQKETKSESVQSTVIQKDTVNNKAPEQGAALVTFIELGSVNCIPCKKMQPIMKSIEQKYGEQVRVIFYDVNKEPERAGEFNIQLIPTQVFLDKNGKEIHRHEGYYPEKEIDKLLQAQGLKAKA
jgi:thioredoxin 1